MKKYIAFYKHWDDKNSNNLTAFLLGFILIIISIVLTNVIPFKEELPAMEKFLLALIVSLLLMALTAGVIAAYLAIHKWIKYDLIPTFKETQEEFDYKPEPKGKVKF